jgi:hypothetical protein
MAFIQLHTLQGIRILQCFIIHITNNDGVGKSIRICIKATQLEVGTFNPFMFLHHSIHGHTTLTASWVHDIWSFLELFQGTITLSDKCNDQSIMTLVILFASHNGKLRHINMCRIFLHAISVSAITGFDGTHLNQKAYEGIRSDDYPTNWWPNQR